MHVDFLKPEMGPSRRYFSIKVVKKPTTLMRTYVSYKCCSEYMCTHLSDGAHPASKHSYSHFSSRERRREKKIQNSEM